MAANVETMFYTREKPWHGLGVKVADALSSKEALTASGLDWQVKCRKELKQSHTCEDKHRRALTVPEQELFLRFLANERSQYHHWHPIFTVMLGTGIVRYQ